MNKSGGFLPLLALLPAILGSAGGLSAEIASAVNGTKQTAEQKRHNLALEKLAQGSGISGAGSNPISVSGAKHLFDRADSHGNRRLRELRFGYAVAATDQRIGVVLAK